MARPWLPHDKALTTAPRASGDRTTASVPVRQSPATPVLHAVVFLSFRRRASTPKSALRSPKRVGTLNSTTTHTHSKPLLPVSGMVNSAANPAATLVRSMLGNTSTPHTSLAVPPPP